ncbi:AMIN-like domain-containing (lipo)protein [Blastococcus sp. SYSU DS0828]
MRFLPAGVCAALLLTACTADGGSSDGGSSDGDAAATASPTASPTTTALSDDQAVEPVGDPGTAAVQGGGFPDADRPVAHLADVRAAGHDGFDRVVLEFEGDRVPSYRVSYVEPPVTQDASGRPVEIEGNAFLELRTSPASTVDLSGERPEQVYEGPERIEPTGGSVVTEVVQTGDFEANMAWTVGLQERVSFGVATLADPLRLVVDVRHPSDEEPGTLQPVGDGDTAESIAAGDGPLVALTDVRLGAHEGFDRLVFELAGEGEAGWRVGYTDEPRAQGSGAPVEVPGDAVLGITLTNIALPFDAPEGVQPWEGPDQQAIAGATVLDTLVEDTLFEGHYTFFAGVDRERPFAVGLLNSPQRIVVDILAEEPAAPVALSQRCESPAGFALSYPESWAVNPGDTVPACTRFAPDPFTVPPGTDARVGAVTASVEPAPFDRVANPAGAEELSRTDTTVGGRTAVRVERVSSGEGLWPEGVRTTSYVVDLGEGEDGPRTLVVNTVGLPQFDYARNVRVLDRMVETLELTEP